MNRNLTLVLLLVAGGLSACGDGTDTPPRGTPVASPGALPDQPSPWTYQACESVAAGNPADIDAAADGIWQGTLTNELSKTTEPYNAIVSADGRFHLLSTGHTQMAGTLEVDGNGYTGEGFAESGGTLWNDGTLVSELTVAGAITEREQLSGELVLVSGDAGCFRLDYDADLYERPSSLDLVDGRWIDYDDWSFLWIALDVTPQGALSGLDIYGCSYSGSMALLDERFNLYAVALDITQSTNQSYTCWGPGSFEGFAHLEDTGDGSIVNQHLSMTLATSEELVDGQNAIRLTLHR